MHIELCAKPLASLVSFPFGSLAPSSFWRWRKLSWQLRLGRLTLVTLASWLRCEAAWACASTLHALQLLSAPHIKRCSASSITLACCAAVLSSVGCFLRDATTLPCFILVILAWLSCFIGVTQHYPLRAERLRSPNTSLQLVV